MFQMADGEGSRKRNLSGEEASQEENVHCLIIFHIIFKRNRIKQFNFIRIVCVHYQKLKTQDDESSPDSANYQGS